MALYDANGNITIDDVAAKNDIMKFNQSAEILRESVCVMNGIISLAYEMKGQTGESIVDQASLLKNKLENMISNLAESSAYIQKTIEHYTIVDQNLKETFQNFENN